ncbi:unnamed protein product [Chrysoparadoxa australica]
MRLFCCLLLVSPILEAANGFITGTSVAGLPLTRIKDRLAEEVEDIRGLRIKAIKEELRSLSVPHADCFEKEELVYRLADARVQLVPQGKSSASSPTGPAFSDGVVVPLIKLQPSKEVLGAGISTDTKDYYAIALDLPDVSSNGQNRLFMVDTAATNTLVTPKAAASMNAQRTGVTATAAAGSGGYGVACP